MTTKRCEVDRCENLALPDRRFCLPHNAQWPKLTRANIEAWLRGELDPVPAAKLCDIKGCLAQPVLGSDLCEVHERAEVAALGGQPAPTGEELCICGHVLAAHGPLRSLCLGCQCSVFRERQGSVPQIILEEKPEKRSNFIPQPAPTTGLESRPVLVLLAKRFEVGEDTLCRLAEREASVGIKRYGVGLHTHNGRDAVRDLHEEALDAVMYAAQAWLEHPEALSETALLRALELEKAVAHMGVKP